MKEPIIKVKECLFIQRNKSLLHVPEAPDTVLHYVHSKSSPRCAAKTGDQCAPLAHEDSPASSTPLLLDFLLARAKAALVSAIPSWAASSS